MEGIWLLPVEITPFSGIARLGKIKTLTSDANWVREIVFHPRGQHLLSASDDYTIRVWELKLKVRTMCTGHTGSRSFRDVHGYDISLWQTSHRCRVRLCGTHSRSGTYPSGFPTSRTVFEGVIFDLLTLWDMAAEARCIMY
ncbi:hypothetical protein C8Q72DRAFT_59659 [Fomitopsis betulina]|nr:hypothetical protein C8Q72DRAFT_59659 [Fomitopsis betulina]